MAAGGRWIPAREVEHAVASGRRRVAPGERALVTLGCAVRRTLKLRLGRKPRAAPARVGLRLRVTDVDRPRGRKSDRFEHAAPGPASRVTLPEQRVPDALPLHPVPVVRMPEAPLPIAAGVDEFHEGRIGHVVALHREGAYVLGKVRTLVVPGEARRPAIDPQRGAARSDLDPGGSWCRALDARPVAGRASLLIPGQSMQHVVQRFLVHGFMLEDHEDGLGPVEQRMTGPVDVAMGQGVDHPRIGRPRELLDDSPARPALAVWLRIGRRRLFRGRIDAAREQHLELRVDAGRSQGGLHQRIEAERGHVAFVEHDGVPERDRVTVVGTLVDQEVEQGAGSLSIAAVPGNESRPVDRARYLRPERALRFHPTQHRANPPAGGSRFMATGRLVTLEGYHRAEVQGRVNFAAGGAFRVALGVTNRAAAEALSESALGPDARTAPGP